MFSLTLSIVISEKPSSGNILLIASDAVIDDDDCDFYFEDAGLDCVVFSCNDGKIKSYLTLRFKCVDQEESLFA